MRDNILARLRYYFIMAEHIVMMVWLLDIVAKIFSFLQIVYRSIKLARYNHISPFLINVYVIGIIHHIKIGPNRAVFHLASTQ